MSGEFGRKLGADEDARKTESHMVKENSRLRNDREIHDRVPKVKRRERELDNHGRATRNEGQPLIRAEEVMPT